MMGDVNMSFKYKKNTNEIIPKVAIISRHAVSNYGSFYQALALEKAILNLGYDACTINYINLSEKSYRLSKIDISNSRWNKNILRRFIFYLIDIPNRTIQFSRFAKFRKEALDLTEEFNSIDEIDSNKINANIYCTGSDQVWNETINNKLDNAYFLDFLDSNIMRFSYAASFGKSTINDSNVNFVKSCLSKYNKISVREDTGVQLLRNLHLSSEQVLDPTFLLTGNEWRKISKDYKVNYNNYILLYQIHKNNDMLDYARKYAAQYGYKLINVSVSFLDKKANVKLEWLPDYKKLLSLFDNAKCVITDSFHATAFSINLNTNFVTFLPKQSTSRNQSVLRLFGLENRAINKDSDFTIPESTINFVKVNKILEKERENSINWLANTLKELSKNE